MKQIGFLVLAVATLAGIFVFAYRPTHPDRLMETPPRSTE
jgi:hypothetical protein